MQQCVKCKGISWCLKLDGGIAAVPGWMEMALSERTGVSIDGCGGGEDMGSKFGYSGIFWGIGGWQGLVATGQDGTGRHWRFDRASHRVGSTFSAHSDRLMLPRVRIHV